jgi:hypothetical protein
MVFSHEVNVTFWTDREMENKYIDQFMTVYLQNKSFEQGDLDYDRTCWSSPYNLGVATMNPPTGAFDLLITDGNVVFNNETGCPDTVENYQFWATVQSNVPIDSDVELDYFINITLNQGSPNQYFWNTINLKAMISILVFIFIGVVTAFVGKWSQSGVVALLTFLILILIKILIGV